MLFFPNRNNYGKHIMRIKNSLNTYQDYIETHGYRYRMQNRTELEINEISAFRFLQSANQKYGGLEIIIIPTNETSEIVDTNNPIIINYKYPNNYNEWA